jgi:hypothetical protein
LKSITPTDTSQIWQGLQIITDHKGKLSCELPSDASRPDELNAFYARFNAGNTEPYMRVPAVPDGSVITLSVADMSKPFNQVNIHKATVPDGLPRHVLRACVDQLASVFTDIFNLLTHSVIPTCFNQTTIVPVRDGYYYSYRYCLSIWYFNGILIRSFCCCFYKEKLKLRTELTLLFF